MAIIHRAELRPSKLELLGPWLQNQEWAQHTHGEPQRVATYRFDDPEGEVGIETFILNTSSGHQIHAPITYRGAPLEGAETHLIGTMDHSVLGKRWAYDATGDPAYAQTLATTILSGGTEVEQYIQTDTGRETIPGTAHVTGSGTTPGTVTLPTSLHTTTSNRVTTITTENHTLVVLRRIGDQLPDGLTHTLHGTWAGRTEPAPLAGVATRQTQPG